MKNKQSFYFTGTLMQKLDEMWTDHIYAYFSLYPPLVRTDLLNTQKIYCESSDVFLFTNSYSANWCSNMTWK